MGEKLNRKRQRITSMSLSILNVLLSRNPFLSEFEITTNSQNGRNSPKVNTGGDFIMNLLNRANNANAPIYNSHALQTQYKYNSLNQLVWQHTPDGGNSQFYYDRLGRLVVSQNAKQAGGNSFSYTRFDNLGRINEVGQITGGSSMTDATAFDNTALSSWHSTNANKREQITMTYYDDVIPGNSLLQSFFNANTQRYLRKRVSASCIYPSYTDLPSSASNIGNPLHATYYSYDIFGNVNELVQYNGSIKALVVPGNEAMAYKKMDYSFDLFSGKVNQMDYQNYKQDHWSHRYNYDADNRLTETYTSTNGYGWEKEAGYEYFLHGPLMRTQLGSRKVQGIDYAYTLQGWIKGINSQTLQSNRDIGHDGTGTHGSVAKDVFGYTLGYYGADYSAIDNTIIPGTDHFIADNSTLNALSPDLWNGNIKNSVTALSKFDVCHDACIPLEIKNASTGAVLYSICIPADANFSQSITAGCASLTITYTVGGNVNIASSENGSTNSYVIPNSGGSASIPSTTPAFSCTSASFVLGHNNGTKANIYWDDASGSVVSDDITITSNSTTKTTLRSCPVTATTDWAPSTTNTITLSSSYSGTPGSGTTNILVRYPWVAFNVPATPGGWTPLVTGIIKIALDKITPSGFEFIVDEVGTIIPITVPIGSGTNAVPGSSFGTVLEHKSGSDIVNAYMTISGVSYLVATYSISGASVGFLSDLDLGNCSITDMTNIKLYDVTPLYHIFEFKTSGGSTSYINVPIMSTYSTSISTACGTYSFNFNYNPGTNGYDIDFIIINPGIQTAITAFIPLNVGTITGLPTNGCFGINAIVGSNNAAVPATALPMGAVYTYDQLNRIKTADYTQDIDVTSNQWTATSIMASYRNTYTYDANGNILTLLRNGIACKNTDMDNLTYHYYSGTNRLSYVDDAVASGNYTNDIDDQAAANYSYDAIGNLVADNAEGITSIAWNVYGKISSITKSSGLTLQFEYDAAGNRVVKRKTIVSGYTTQVTTEFYIRDASGNVIANYSYESSALTWTESPIYGSSRVGVYRPNKVITNNINNYECCFEYIRGQRNYELTNHLGNVQAVITDKKIQVCVSGTTNHFEADVVSEVDYYPFGMLMPERSYASPVYRYGFNGKENDNEVKGEGNQQDYGFRISDPRLGRFLSVDPLTKSFPELTPYQYASNSPIVNIDLDGEEGMWYIFAKCGVFGQTTANIANGTEAGIKASVTKTYTFVTSDMWKASTWESAANAFGTLCDITVGNMDGRNDQLAYNVIQPKVDNFKKEVINGDAYSRSKYISEVGADILTAYIGSKGLSALKSSAMGMARGSLASSFYAESGYTAESALQHMEGINFAKPVQTTTLAKGTVVQQWVGENGVGNYFTPLENGASQNLGMPDYAKRTLKQFTLTEDVKVLKSTAADYKGNAGGGTQYFSTELKVKIKPN